MNCFGDYKKSSIFAPAIEKRWRDSSLLGGFHSWRSFLLKQDRNTTGTQNDINVHKKRNTLYIMYSPLRKEYIQDLHYNFSTSSLDKPVAPIINSVGEPTCFK